MAPSRCYHLDEECGPQTQGFDIWSPAAGLFQKVVHPGELYSN